jgi:protein ImuA
LSGRLPLGIARADEWLGGGLACNGLHEAYAAAMEDGAAAIGFALALARIRAGEGGSPLVWLRERGRPSLPYGPGLHQFGIAPAQVTLLALPDAKSVLRAASDCARAGAAAAVLVELAGRQKLLDLTASRRLVLAAAHSGTMLLLVRQGAEPSPSAAHTRWHVASAPSRGLDANAPGHPAFDLALTRHKGARDGLHLILEWNSDTVSFTERTAFAATPLSGARSAMAAGGAGDPFEPRAA